MSKKATAIVGYIGIIGFLIAYLAGDKEGAKFDLNQGLVLSIAAIFSAILSRVPYVGFIFYIVNLVVFVFAIVDIINAAQDKETPLPLIGGIQLLK